jgi:hypothetical protein
MGRPSKLTDNQWEQIQKRMLGGESASELAREYGVTEGAIRKKVSTKIVQIKTIAKQMVEVESIYEALPINTKIAVRTLADELKEISMHLASAARYGAATAHRLAGIANEKTDDLDPADIIDMNRLREIAALTRTANEASNIGINLIKANQEAIKQSAEKEMSSVPRRIVSKEDAARAYMELISG